jgi:hypothetical protein
VDVLSGLSQIVCRELSRWMVSLAAGVSVYRIYDRVGFSLYINVFNEVSKLHTILIQSVKKGGLQALRVIVLT